MPELIESRKKRAFFTRKAAPKVKTGCYTCKTRRVKCDETKPECLRCIKFGVAKCAYPGPRERPKLAGLAQKTESRFRPIKPASVYQPRSGPKFNDDEEYRCFQLFTRDAMNSLAGVFSNALWTRIAQAAENESFVRECFVAIGALERAAALPQACPHTTDGVMLGDGHISVRAFAYALGQYGKAIQSMRMALVKNPQNIRLTLIACLLVFCFESYVGNQIAAITHAQSGIALLRQWAATKVLSGSSDIRSPAPYVIEDDLVQAFSRLDLQVSIILDTRDIDFHIKIKGETCIAMEKMPSKFTTIDEARIWCEMLMRWNYHFRAEAISAGMSHEIQTKCSELDWESGMDTPMGTNVLHEPKEVPIAFLPECRAHVSKTQQWLQAFSGLFKTLRARPDKVKEIVGGVMLQVQCKMSGVTLASAFFGNEMGYDDYISEFRDIVALTALVEPHAGNDCSKKRLAYHFDGGFIPPLFLVATKCRDRALRREGIRLLFSKPKREGVFDSICVAHMAEWLMKLEEEGIPTDEQIPDHRRVRIRRSNIDLQMRRAQLQGTQLRSPDDLEVEWKETVLTW